MWKRSLISLLVLTLFFLTTPAAKTQVAGASNGKAAAVAAGLAGAGAVIGFAVYFAVHHGHSLTGCAASRPGELQLMNEGDQKSYELTGDTTGIKAGDRVRVSGSKAQGNPSARQFVVTKLSKNYGACRTTPATS